jgi:hypothetical protein
MDANCVCGPAMRQRRPFTCTCACAWGCHALHVYAEELRLSPVTVPTFGMDGRPVSGVPHAGASLRHVKAEPGFKYALSPRSLDIKSV